jgi:hypothetical protein
MAALAICAGVLTANIEDFSLPAAAKQLGVVLSPKTPQQGQAADLLIKASQLLQEKKQFAARPLLEQACALWPDSPHIHYNLGCCYEQIGLFDKAIDEYEKALQIEPKLSECIANIASCYQLVGKPLEAIAWFEGYLKAHPHAEDSEQVRGMIAALRRQADRQVDSDPQAGDYLASISPQGKPQRWQYNRLPIKIFISAGCDDDGRPIADFRPQYNNILYDAFITWQKASNNKLAYTFVQDPQIADIACWWTDRKDFLKDQGTKVEQGAAKVSSRPLRDGSGEEIGRVKVIVLIRDPENKHNISDDEMKKACLHEIGHALGFAGHSPNNKDIMFFSDSPTVWSSLTRRDKSTMARLYADYPVIPGLATGQVQPTTTAAEAFAISRPPSDNSSGLFDQAPAAPPVTPPPQWPAPSRAGWGQQPQGGWAQPGAGQQQPPWQGGQQQQPGAWGRPPTGYPAGGAQWQTGGQWQGRPTGWPDQPPAGQWPQYNNQVPQYNNPNAAPPWAQQPQQFPQNQ